MSARGTHHFVIEPLKGVGPIRFGMHKEQVSHAFTYVYRSFFKGRKPKVRSDQVEVVGLIVHYDDDSRVNFIEVVKPIHGTVKLELFGQDITGITIRDMAVLMRANSAVVHRTTYGYDCPELALSTFNTDPRSEDAVVECIGVGPGNSTAA